MPFQTSENKRLTGKWLRLSIFSGARKGSQHLRKNAFNKTENSITALDRRAIMEIVRHSDFAATMRHLQSRYSGSQEERAKKMDAILKPAASRDTLKKWK
jgi:hypothetical protein